jgi:hypothetical protein
LDRVETMLRNDVCCCESIFELHPHLNNKLGHVVLREKRDWEPFLATPQEVQLVTGHARNVLTPTAKVFEQCLAQFYTSLKNAAIPVFDATENSLVEATCLRDAEG